MIDFLQIYGQAIAYGVFIVLMLALLCYMIILRPRATCCSADRKRSNKYPEQRHAWESHRGIVRPGLK